MSYAIQQIPKSAEKWTSPARVMKSAIDVLHHWVACDHTSKPTTDGYPSSSEFKMLTDTGCIEKETFLSVGLFSVLDFFVSVIPYY